MNTEELKMIIELFSTITDGALVGGVSYLVMNLISNLTPWFISGYIITKLMDKLPKVLRDEEK